MNRIGRIEAVLTRATVNACHPERSLAKSEAIRQTESKDPYNLYGGRGDARNFRIVVRFFDDHDTEVANEPSREAAPGECPARQCRVATTHTIESRRDATHV